MNILIIGGTGVLSSAVTNEAIKHGISVTMINRGNNINALPIGVKLIKSDKKDYSLISKALCNQSFDAILDFLLFTEEDAIDSYTFYSKYTKQYFYISSCAVYNTHNVQICKEDSPKVLQEWDYSIEKWASEEKISEIAKNYNTKITIIRPCVTYGYTRIPYGIAPTYGYHWTLAARILAGKPIITWNNGENRCNMTRVEDFAVGVVGLIGNPKAYNEAFNVCGDEAPTFNQVIDAMSEYLGKKAIKIDIDKDFYGNELDWRKGELLGGRCVDAINSNKKIKAVVPEFRQTILLNDGIKMTLDAYKNMNYQKGIDWSFDADSDRIIHKWCKTINIDDSKYHLGFTDYFGKASSLDRIKYWLEYNKRNIFVKTIRRFVSFTRFA